MQRLSISAAWEEAKAIFARDGRLLMAVALALVAFPAAVNSLINPRGTGAPVWADIVALGTSLVALAGQLALIRLALGPSITVGGAIGHGIRRTPTYLLSVIVIIAGLAIVAIPLALLLAVLGVPLDVRPIALSPAVLLVGFLYVGLLCFIGVRLILSAPVASAERVGPIAILRRSWTLTAGHWWPLFGFLLIFLVGAVILLLAVGAAVGVVIGLFIGSIQPMSAGALVLALVQSLVSAAVTTLFAVMVTRIYLQLVGRGEAQSSVPSSGI
jgi:hypothetical protein